MRKVVNLPDISMSIVFPAWGMPNPHFSATSGNLSGNSSDPPLGAETGSWYVRSGRGVMLPSPFSLKVIWLANWLLREISELSRLKHQYVID